MGLGSGCFWGKVPKLPNIQSLLPTVELRVKGAFIRFSLAVESIYRIKGLALMDKARLVVFQ